MLDIGCDGQSGLDRAFRSAHMCRNTGILRSIICGRTTWKSHLECQVRTYWLHTVRQSTYCTPCHHTWTAYVVHERRLDPQLRDKREHAERMHEHTEPGRHHHMHQRLMPRKGIFQCNNVLSFKLGMKRQYYMENIREAEGNLQSEKTKSELECP